MPLDVINIPSPHLPNFWFGLDHHDVTLDATMLRAAEWSDSAIFGDWWKRLAREKTELTLQGDMDAASATTALVAINLARSDLGLELMPRVIEHYLALAEVHQPAWRSDEAGRPQTNVLVAAAIAFVHSRVRGTSNKLVTDACEELLRNQQQCGAWCIRTGLPEPCVMTTAYAIHALALAKPTGAKRALEGAANWLRTQQQPSGCWKNWDPIHLTVLALDALTLAANGTTVTFGRKRSLVRDSVQHEFSQSLSVTVNPVHFEDFSGEQFERLVFAYHLRTESWRELEWYGQVGSDLGATFLEFATQTAELYASSA